ncbi:hydantoinase/oxoprolinase family protein [Bordetella pertussis]|uniref:Hydantoin utilization protein A n=3 Tax=Bordetella pertussis TaxID=520 RepID=Q7VZR8_BORPE|nr:hydantoin utilization protein A [Bordetella pertussis CS]AIW93242.1 hydantoin utilization protein A [Bordetella pertussis B1917]AIW94833.1 hydantoin utilization protein A [Bordetella pertussis B1920]AJB25562.1 hydantoin utilization protein A [Bordetella pertussis 137]ALH50293.1 hydantoin utilization protein A [Bordetella pertussis]ETH00276.1 hydantoinase/oxoprolinase [Bordetella pertussis 2250905]ETH03993.1 hydantoinase/oxoprolinase [Bordetella pertussis 2356847]ETH06515.1 hydantoinase/ox
MRDIDGGTMGYRVGVDIGGSFTDFAVFDEDNGEIKSLKVFSRPDQPGEEVIAGVRMLGERYGIQPEQITYFTHGTTVGINTVIQRKGLKLALFTTENFSDVLELARLKTPDMYHLLSRRPAPLVKRSMVFGIAERMGPDGTVRAPLDEASVERAVRQALDAGAEGIVVSLLHAYRNPAHELRVREIAEALAPGLPVSCSSETWPIIREYERTITAVIGGYVQPRVAHYLTSLQQALKNAGVQPEPRLTKSNGGVMTAEQGKRDCVQMILSGTAAGVIGASHVAATAGLPRCLSLDIGGTSADIAVIVDGKPQYGVGELIGDFQIYIPSVSVSSVGEGGGSIAWVDPLGVLKVGPESAGSHPGPACYRRGGTRATITDAFVCCGLVGHSELGYQAVTVDADASRQAVGELADRLGRGIEETAEAIIQIAVSGMYSEVSGLVSRYGIDPREYAVLAFGGAGPMLGCFLARELKVREIVVPPSPGTLSALGGLIADLKSDFLKTVYTDLSADRLAFVCDEFATLAGRARQWLAQEQGHAEEAELVYSAEMRYRGQSYEIDTVLDPIHIEAGDVQAVGQAFHDMHRRLYGHADEQAPVQIVSLRVVIAGNNDKPAFPRHALRPGAPRAERKVRVWLDGAWHEVPLYARTALAAGQQFTGPAIVTQDDCTTVIPPDYACRVDEYANLRITEGAAS